jgi:hypothetical protein
MTTLNIDTHSFISFVSTMIHSSASSSRGVSCVCIKPKHSLPVRLHACARRRTQEIVCIIITASHFLSVKATATREWATAAAAAAYEYE